MNCYQTNHQRSQVLTSMPARNLDGISPRMSWFELQYIRRNACLEIQHQYERQDDQLGRTEFLHLLKEAIIVIILTTMPPPRFSTMRLLRYNMLEYSFRDHRYILDKNSGRGSESKHDKNYPVPLSIIVTPYLDLLQKLQQPITPLDGNVDKADLVFAANSRQTAFSASSWKWFVQMAFYKFYRGTIYRGALAMPTPCTVVAIFTAWELRTTAALAMVRPVMIDDTDAMVDPINHLPTRLQRTSVKMLELATDYMNALDRYSLQFHYCPDDSLHTTEAKLDWYQKQMLVYV
jgi:hypothetical protein